MNALNEIQNWYAAQCDGDWEHQHGVKIETLDNPGWSVSVNLSDTALEGIQFNEVEDNYDHAKDWMCCKVDGTTFKGVCGPHRLEDVLRVFLDWERSSDSRPSSEES